MAGARRARGRALDGILLLDKPGGVTSNGVLQRCKRLFDAAKAGHTGALDPLATGMLPICFGEATKFSQFLLDSDKRYRTTAKLGVRTDSSDADGQVIAEAPIGDEVTEARIRELLEAHFNGWIEQVPSMYSALKFNGQPLYKLARQGIQVEVKPRQVCIHQIELLDFRGDELDLEVHCSKGTYIRSIVEDLGLLLGCGAHVTRLHRLECGPFKAAQMTPLAELEQLAELTEADQGEIKNAQARLDRLLLPVWSALGDTPQLTLAADQVTRIKNGQVVVLPAQQQTVASTDCVALFEADGEHFIGVGELDEQGHLKARRLMKTG
ncbi:tRNA pseudouridine(55) synthase TruB [Marinobacterium arenosum]|uniref:tRNA pseudouridine(55) synthase TruB n=1 Tax=Marinobacterium arenosum TaxID=2862496 RepID=UPI001C9547C1|nr:tRNA pseudouridine(55) synthase TruB [Marinobacterium arenosum]MBY4678810.1 tRNA pseudouridine(55) synthase TruB [Marinobacterium arenosum]